MRMSEKQFRDSITIDATDGVTCEHYGYYLLKHNGRFHIVYFSHCS